MREVDKVEIEALLNVVKDKVRRDEYSRRLQGPRKHGTAALMELRVALHLERSGFPVVEWSPLGAGGNKGEFVVKGPAKVGIFVEVKGPEWESEVPEDELKAGRSRQPKYIDRECRPIPPRYKSVQSAIDKAYKKFGDDTPNLLVVADDLFISLEHETEFEVKAALYSNSPTCRGHFSDQRYERLGGVGVFWVRSGIWVSEDKQSLGYHMRLFLNPNALSTTALPLDMQRAFQDTATEGPKVPLVGREQSPFEKYAASPSEWK